MLESTKAQVVQWFNNKILAAAISLKHQSASSHSNISKNTHMPLMPTYLYKQPLGIWINSKQDGDLTHTNSKGRYRIESRHQDLHGNPLRGKTTGGSEQSTIWRSNTRGGSQQGWGGSKSPTDFTFYWIDLVDLSLSFSLPNPSSLPRIRTQHSIYSRVGDEPYNGSFS
jgi:hypothetical protein